MKFLSGLYCQFMSEARSQDNRLFLFFCGLCLAVFAGYKHFFIIPASAQGNAAGFAASLLVALACARVKITSLPAANRIVLRVILGLFCLYLLASFPTLPLDHLDPLSHVLMGQGRYAAALCAAIGFFRPSFGLIPLIYVVWYKGVLSRFMGYEISWTDYTPLVEVGLVITFSALIWAGISRFSFWRPLIDVKKDQQTLLPLEKLFLLSVAVHMANYFHSGFKKLWLGDNVLSWALHNKTQYLISNAEALGQLPTSFSDTLTGLSYQALAFVVVPTNFILLAGQLLALVALFRIRWGITATLFYDLTHAVIFVTSGIFFYKWIALNAAIVMALNTMRKKTVPIFLRALILATIILSPGVFFVANLGWWDTPALNVERIDAVTRDGREIAVPSNFWGAFSVRMAQQRLIADKSDGFFPTGTYGATPRQEDMRTAESCGFKLPPAGQSDVIDKTFAQDSRIEDFIRNYHQWALNRAGEKGNWIYDLYPHHIFSSPWEFMDFMKVDLHDIVAYRYSITAICASMDRGAMKKVVVREKSHVILIE